MEQNKDRVLESTTTNFSGMVASIDPEQHPGRENASWVARFIETYAMVPGMYAIKATAAELSEELEEILRENDIQLPKKD